MKKILNIVLVLILILSSFNLLSAYNLKQVDNILQKYYIKIDKKYPEIQKRIDRLEKINKKIDNILEIKKNKLSKKNKELLFLVQFSLLKKISSYNSQLEEVNLGEIFDEEENGINNNIKNTNTVKYCKTLNAYMSEGNTYYNNKSYNISNGKVKYLIGYKCTNGKIIEFKKELLGITCNIGYEKENNKCIKKVKKDCDIYDIKDGDIIQTNKKYNINNGKEKYLVYEKCDNGKIIEQKKVFLQLDCNNGFEEESKKCVKSKKRYFNFDFDKDSVKAGEKFKITWDAEGYDYCIPYGENVKDINGKEWTQMKYLGNGKFIQGRYGNKGYKEFIIYNEGYVGLGLQCYYTKNSKEYNTSLRKSLKILPAGNKNCGFYNGIKYYNGDTGTTSKDKNIQNGLIREYYDVKCSNGKINLTKSNKFNKSTICNNGYEEKNNICVEKDIYEVNVAVIKQVGLDDDEAVIKFIVDKAGGVDEIKILSIETDGDSYIKNDDYKYINYPELIEDRDEWYIIVGQEGDKSIDKITYKVYFKEESGKEPIEIKKDLNLNLGNYRKD